MRVVEVEVVRDPGPPVPAALYARDDVTGHGSALSVDGTDYCGSAAAKPPVYTFDPATTSMTGSPTMQGTPASPQSGTYYDIILRAG